MYVRKGNIEHTVNVLAPFCRQIITWTNLDQNIWSNMTTIRYSSRLSGEKSIFSLRRPIVLT